MDLVPLPPHLRQHRQPLRHAGWFRLVRDNIPVGFNALRSIILFSFPLLAAPLRWASGQLTDVERKHGFYYYKIVSGNDRYTGRSLHLYRVSTDTIKFTVHGSSLYILDESGKTKKTRYVLQELIPPVPPPPPVPSLR
jgi:hypothetical protein